MEYVQIDNSDLQSFEITQKAISNGSLAGTCELGKAEIQLINDNNKYSNYKNKWIKTLFGSLFVYDVEPVQENVNIKLSCYDIKQILDVEYDKNYFIQFFPCTIGEWRNKIAQKYGFKFNDNGKFPNSTFVLPTHPYVEDNSKVRDVIKKISFATWVETDSEDNFYFKWVNSTKTKIDDWLELTTEKESTDPVNVVVLGRGDVEDIVTYPKVIPDNPKEFRIDNNYILDPQDSSASTDRRENVIKPIYEQVKDLSYIIYQIRTPFVDNVFNITLGSKIEYTDIYGNDLESIVMSKTLKWLGGELDDPKNWEVTLSAEEINESSSDYKMSTPAQTINKLGVFVDKENKKIESIVEQIGDRTSKTTSLTQDIDTITSIVSASEDITETLESTSASVDFENEINESEPIHLKIRPTSENISYTYPFNINYDEIKEKLEYNGGSFYAEYYGWYGKDHVKKYEDKGLKLTFGNLKNHVNYKDKKVQENVDYLVKYCDSTTLLTFYPCEPFEKTDYKLEISIVLNDNINDIFPQNDFDGIRIVEFFNKDTNEKIDYELPDDLLFYDENNYDEFELDNESQVCKITKRCDYNELGEVILLDEVVTTTYEFPKINLTKGHYSIKLLSYDNGFIEARLMVVNQLTDKFATKVELRTAITQTSEKISLEVSKKVGKDEFGTTIQQSYKDIQIAWNNISKYIKYENAEMNIYDENSILMSLNSTGQFFYDSGVYLGKIGTNHLKGDESKRSLDFDLDVNANFITWASKKDEDDELYWKWTYTKGGISSAQDEGLYAGANIYMNGFNIYNGRLFTQSDGNGLVCAGNSIMSDGGLVYIGGYTNDTCNLYVNGEMYSNNFSSDVRLKENIDFSDTNGIDVIKNINLYSFDWKNKDEHITTGFIAQELEEVNNNFVIKRPIFDENNEIVDYQYYVNELPILATVTKAVQEQETKIEYLESIFEKAKNVINFVCDKLGLEFSKIEDTIESVITDDKVVKKFDEIYGNIKEDINNIKNKNVTRIIQKVTADGFELIKENNKNDTITN